MLSAKKMARSENDDGLVFQGGVGAKSAGGRTSGLSSRGAGFQAKASVNIGSFFGGRCSFFRGRSSFFSGSGFS